VGDGTGRVIAIGERECSLQRRNQKIIEIAPSPSLSPAMRAELQGKQASIRCPAILFRRHFCCLALQPQFSRHNSPAAVAAGHLYSAHAPPQRLQFTSCLLILP
jgi:hypothetical protein